MSVTAMVKLENSRDINGNDVEDGIKSEQLSDDDTLDVDGRNKNLTTLIIPEPKKMSLIPGIAHTDKHSRLLFEKQSPSSSPVINPDMPVYPPFQWQPHLYPGLPHHFPYYPFRFPGFPFPSMSEHFGFRPYTEHLNAYLPHSAMFPSHPFPTGVTTFQLPGGNDKLFCTDSKIIESDMNGMKSAFDTVKNNSQSPKVYKKAVSPPIDENVNVTISERKKSKEVEQTKYQCSACQKSYSTFSGLSKHKQFHCTQDTKTEFTCKYCDKIYVSLGALKMHIRTHTLPCKCKICGKAFSRPWLLQGHIRTHTGEKPFSCVHCLRAFADRSNLRAHLQTHSDIKKYSCKTCNKTFSRMSLLSKHEDTCGTMDL